MPQDVAAVLAAAFAGPPALPYAAEFRYLVQQHLTELVQVRGAVGRRSAAPVPALTLPCSCRRRPRPPPLPASLQDLPSLHIKTRDYTHIDGRCAKVPDGAAALVLGTAAPARGVLALPPARLTPSVPLLPQNCAPAAGGGHGADVVPSKN